MLRELHGFCCIKNNQYIYIKFILIMKTKTVKVGLSGAVPQKENKKHSKTYLAFQNAVKNPGIKIIDYKAVLK